MESFTKSSSQIKVKKAVVMVQSEDNDMNITEEKEEPKVIKFGKKETEEENEEDIEKVFVVGDKGLDECKLYLDKVNFAQKMVKRFVKEAFVLAKSRTSLESSPSIKSSTNIQTSWTWPLVYKMDYKAGQEAIENYINSLKMREAWQYKVFFLKKIEGPCNIEYQYEVIFSLPTNEYPIVQAYSSVFFYLEASKLKHGDCCVDVYYHFENMSLIRNAKVDQFREFWLNIILDCKLELYKTLTF